MPTVPDVLGIKYSKAVEEILVAGLSVGDVQENLKNRWWQLWLRPNRVLDQDPKPGAVLAENSGVNLILLVRNPGNRQ